MNKTTLSLLMQFAILVPMQAVLFNNLVLFNLAVPMVFIYLIASLPVTMGVNRAMTIAFCAGLCVDVMSDTPGVNSLACTLLAFVHNGVFHLYMPSDADLAEQSPSIRNMGLAAYLKYLLTLSFIYCTIVFAVESIQVWNPLLLAGRIVASTLYTFAMTYAIATLARSRREKRL